MRLPSVLLWRLLLLVLFPLTAVTLFHYVIVGGRLTDLAMLLLGDIVAFGIVVAGMVALIRRPARRLLRSAERWQAGDFSVRTGLRQDATEFGALGMAFDAMAAALEAREAALEAAKAESALILESVNDAFFALSADMRFTYANRHTLQIYGLTWDQMVGHGLTELFPAAADSDVVAIYREVIADRTMREFDTTSPSLGRWMHAKAFPHGDHGVAVYFHDIHERKLAEERLEQANAQLEQRVKARTAQLESALRQIKELDETKSRFFANVSHELRTPLALILGPVDGLLAQPDVPSEWRNDLAVIRRNAHTLLTLVNDLLDLARFDAGHMVLEYSVTDLVALVRSVIDHFASTVLRGVVELSFDAPPRLMVQVDRDKILRVAFNIISNAFKHVPAGSGRVEVAVSTAGDQAVIEVVDNGPGVPPHLREVVFHRFVHGGDHASGSGLGLAIASEFVGLHGGDIVVDDAPGHSGARFRVSLPLLAGSNVAVAPELTDSYPAIPDEAAVAVPPSEISETAPVGSLPLILVVEDNPDLRVFIASSLKSVARVIEADDGMAGLAAAKRCHPDLVLTDIMMPRLTGDKMVADLRRYDEFADTPMMVLSARADDPLRTRLLRGQVQDYLVKPFAADELRARAVNLLQARRARRLLQAELDKSHGTLEELARQIVELNQGLRFAADAMRIAKDKAEQALRVRSEFLNMVSHELRTPLTQLGLQLELHQRLFRSGLTERQRDGLMRTTAAFDRLAKLVDSLLEYSRIRSGRLTVNREILDVAALVSDVVAEFKEHAKRRGLDLVLMVAGNLPPLRSDPALLAIVVRNLLDNAVKFTDCGKVSVQVTVREGSVRIEVSDSGPGIPPALQERMFEPFEQSESIDRKHTPGVGLGLALVKDVTAALGGQVMSFSEPGNGSRFAVEFGVVEEES